jgi:hypothetical protein
MVMGLMAKEQFNQISMKIELVIKLELRFTYLKLDFID